jgi:hypothetical protein
LLVSLVLEFLFGNAFRRVLTKATLIALVGMKVVSAAELYLSLRLSLDLELDIRILSMDPASAPAVY